MFRILLHWAQHRTEICVFTCMCLHVCACVCVRMCMHPFGINEPGNGGAEKLWGEVMELLASPGSRK